MSTHGSRRTVRNPRPECGLCWGSTRGEAVFGGSTPLERPRCAALSRLRGPHRLRRCYPLLVIASPLSSVPEILMRRTNSIKIRAVLVLGLCFAAPLYAHHLKKGESTTLPVTTSSAKARELYEKGMADYENLYLERCNEEWRAAVKEDPNLAVAWAWIAFNSGTPQEVSQARAKAKELAPKFTPGEQLMVAWISKVQEGDFLGGITAMNDMLEMYPRDKHLLYLAGNWLMGENGNDQAQRMMEKALAIDKNFP